MSGQDSPRLVGLTDCGEAYELMIVVAGLGEPAPCVRLAVMAAPARLTLAPDEARALAADLQRWAGHAERERKRTR